MHASADYNSGAVVLDGDRGAVAILSPQEARKLATDLASAANYAEGIED